MNNRMGYVYIGSPYSHPDADVRQQRYHAAACYLHKCLVVKKWAYSPIVHCHYLSVEFGLPPEAEFWREYDFTMLARAHTFEILCIGGWRESVGLEAERLEAERLGIPVVYV